MAFWHDRHATALSPSALHLTLLCLLTVFLRLTSALQCVAGSPCESVCADAGTLNEDVVCLDADYQSLPQGRAYQKCVACQLNSTAVDTSKNETDVGWGLCMLPTLFYLLRTLFMLQSGGIKVLNKSFQWPFATPSQGACLPGQRRISPSAVLVKSAALRSTRPSTIKSRMIRLLPDPERHSAT